MIGPGRCCSSKVAGPAPGLFLLAGAVVGLFFLVSLVSIAPHFSRVELIRVLEYAQLEPQQTPLDSSSCPNHTVSGSTQLPVKPAPQQSSCLECDLLLLNNVKRYEDVGLTPCDISYYELEDFGRWLASKKADGQNLAVSFGDSLMRIQTQTIFKTAPIEKNSSGLGSKSFWADILCCNSEVVARNASPPRCRLYFAKELRNGVSPYMQARDLLHGAVHEWCWIFHWVATPAELLKVLPGYFSNASSITPAAVVVNPVLHHMHRNNTRRHWVNNLHKLADLVQEVFLEQDLRISQGNLGQKTRFLYHTGTAVYESQMAFFVPLNRKEREAVLNKDLERVLKYERPGLFTVVDANRLTQAYWYHGLIKPPKGSGAHPEGEEFYVLINIVDWNYLIRNLSAICIKEDSVDNLALNDSPRGEARDKLAAESAYPVPRFERSK